MSCFSDPSEQRQAAVVRAHDGACVFNEVFTFERDLVTLAGEKLDVRLASGPDGQAPPIGRTSIDLDEVLRQKSSEMYRVHLQLEADELQELSASLELSIRVVLADEAQMPSLAHDYTAAANRWAACMKPLADTGPLDIVIRPMDDRCQVAGRIVSGANGHVYGSSPLPLFPKSRWSPYH